MCIDTCKQCEQVFFFYDFNLSGAIYIVFCIWKLTHVLPEGEARSDLSKYLSISKISCHIWIVMVETSNSTTSAVTLVLNWITGLDSKHIYQRIWMNLSLLFSVGMCVCVCVYTVCIHIHIHCKDHKKRKQYSGSMKNLHLNTVSYVKP